MKVKSVINAVISRMATVGVMLLSAVLFICANTASCGMVYQPPMPDGIEQFRKVK